MITVTTTQFRSRERWGGGLLSFIKKLKINEHARLSQLPDTRTRPYSDNLILKIILYKTPVNMIRVCVCVCVCVYVYTCTLRISNWEMAKQNLVHNTSSDFS